MAPSVPTTDAPVWYGIQRRLGVGEKGVVEVLEVTQVVAFQEEDALRIPETGKMHVMDTAEAINEDLHAGFGVRVL